MGFFKRDRNDWNQGGGASGERAQAKDKVVGETSRLAGNKGVVNETGEEFGDAWVEVTWTEGPRAGRTERVRQGEVGGTNL